MRKIILFLCVLFLLLAPMTVNAEETKEALPIASAEEFLAFAEQCRLDSFSANLVVTLETDIDLDGVAFTPIPIFRGVFNGNGHSITGLSITADGSSQGLFRYLTKDAIVQDLTVSGIIQPGGSSCRVGSIAGINEGTIQNCAFSGTVVGSNSIGGIAGMNTVTGVIENCSIKGQIYGKHFVGGITGENHGVIRDCSNEACINTTPQQNDIQISDITMDSLTNTEASNTVTDIGGIAGISSGVIRDCDNHGDVGYPHIGYNLGGIAGTQSGYIVDCENHGAIQGRKEVGGIVGQMEPSSVITYSQDTFQILDGQLAELSNLLNRASGNAQTNADQISGQINILQEHTQTAQDAVASLIPDPDAPQAPDPDAALAALNTLSGALNAMPGTVRSITEAAKTTAGSLSRDLRAIMNKAQDMESTLQNTAENIGGGFTDISDEDTAETLNGKVEVCINYGSVLADLNAGGIAGAIAMENDLDILSDWDTLGEESLNFQSQIRAVILNCENTAMITAKKYNAGGIAGWQALGLIKGCTNTGMLDCTTADYVGGIAGLSTGYIRNAYVNCLISANSYAGGIAGSASIITDSIALVKITDSTENTGAIAGFATETDAETPITGNQYLCIDKDPGGIDGISYEGLASAFALEELLTKEEIPESFKTVSISFIAADGEKTVLPVSLGDSLSPADIPPVPEQDGYIGQWSGLETADLEHILFDMTFHAEYTSHNRVIECPQLRENGLPIFLLEGSFANEEAITLTASDCLPTLTQKQTLTECWMLSESGSDMIVHYLPPETVKPGNAAILIYGSDNDWKEISFCQSGKYLVFTLTAGDRYFAYVQSEHSYRPWIIGTAAGVLILISVIAIPCAVKAGKKRKAQKHTTS